jgi:hypothetical protein
MAKSRFIDITNKVKSYFEPSAKGVRIRDVSREIPMAAFNIAKNISGVQKLGEGLGRAIYNATPAGKELDLFLDQGSISPEEYTDIKTGGVTNREVVGSALRTGALFVPAGISSALKGANLATQTAAGAATGYAFDVGRNLEANKQGARAFRPGAGTAVGALAPTLSRIDVAHPIQSAKSLFVSPRAGAGVVAGEQTSEGLMSAQQQAPQANPQETVQMVLDKMSNQGVARSYEELYGNTLKDAATQLRAQGLEEAAQNISNIDISQIDSVDALRQSMFSAVNATQQVNPQEAIDMAVNNWVDTFKNNAEEMLNQGIANSQEELFTKTIEETAMQLRANGLEEAAQNISNIDLGQIDSFDTLRQTMFNAINGEGAAQIMNISDIRPVQTYPTVFGEKEFPLDEYALKNFDKINPDMVNAIKSGTKLPPVPVSQTPDGKFILSGDGANRYSAYKFLGIDQIPVIIQ